MRRSIDAVVIGAGPAGLATSRALALLGVAHVVLERGQPGHTWANLYDSLVLHTGRALSSLPELEFPRGTPQFPSRAELLLYLRRYAETFDIPVESGADVVRARHDQSGWTIETRDGSSLRAAALVVATGVAANPYVPGVPQRDRFGGRVIHSAEYRRPEPYVGRRVLVVGAGNSAGEIAAELAQAGARATVAIRSGATTVPRDIAGVPIQYLAIAVAWLPRRAQQLAAAAVGEMSSLVRGASPLPTARVGGCRAVPLIGFHLVDAVKAGRIVLRGGVDSFTPDGVRFADGAEEAFDDVILATGYRAALGFLGDAIRLDACGFGLRRGLVASADHPSLFFVGHNYDSRGALLNIARDSRRAARSVSEWLCGTARTSTEMSRRSSGTRSESSRRSSAGRDAASSG